MLTQLTDLDPQADCVESTACELSFVRIHSWKI